MFEQDYLLRQIKEFIAFMMKLLFGAELRSADELIEYQQNSGDGSGSLFRMIDSGDIRKAEELLYESMQTKTADNLLKGYAFYQYLAQQEDEFLLLEGKGIRGWVHEKYWAPDLADTAREEGVK